MPECKISVENLISKIDEEIKDSFEIGDIDFAIEDAFRKKDLKIEYEIKVDIKKVELIDSEN